MSLSEYERSLPDFEIKDGVLIKSRAKGDVIVVPEGVVEIGHKAFCETKLKEVVLPSTLKKISSFAFSDCRYLKRVTLPDGIEVLGFYAFADTGIEDINFPDSLMEIDNAAFRGTPFMEKLKDEQFVVLGERFLCLYNGYDETIEVPNGVEVICSGAFTDRKSEDYPYFLTPTRIILPDSVKRIEESAFKYLRGLKEINLREDIEIAENAFDYSGYEGKFKAFLASKGEPK